MKIKYILLFQCLVLFVLRHAISQNIDSTTIKKQAKFDQLYCFSSFDNLINNPAYTGIIKGHTLTFSAGIDKPMVNTHMLYHDQAYSFNYEMQLGSEDNQTGLGLSISNYKSGISSSSPVGIYFSQSHRFQTKSKLLKFHEFRMGFSTSYVKELLQFQKLTFGDMIDPRYGFVHYTIEMKPPSNYQDYFSVNSGLLYRNNISYFSFSCNNIINIQLKDPPYNTKANELKEYNISAGATMNINNGFRLGISAFGSLYFGKLKQRNKYSPSITAIYSDIFFASLCYRSFCELSIKIGSILFGRLMLSAEYAISDKKVLNNGEGIPAFAGVLLKYVL